MDQSRKVLPVAQVAAAAMLGPHNCAFLTLDMLDSTSNGVTVPLTVTFLAAKSMLKDLTPSILEICFLIFLSHPLQCNDTLSTTTCTIKSYPHLIK